jgi:hypothetical protein
MLSREEDSSMKILGRLVALSLLAALIVLPAVRSVNYTASKPAIAEGAPLPWPKPPLANDNAVLMAEGAPLPWPKPPMVSLVA